MDNSNGGKIMETEYQTKVMSPSKPTSKVPSPKDDSIQPDRAKEDRMNKEIQSARGSFIFTYRGARYRFSDRKQAEIQWRICNP